MNSEQDIQFRMPQEIKAYQEAKLRETVAYIAANSPFYKRMFAQHGIVPSRVATFEDLGLLPVTTKRDIQLHGKDFLCVSRSRVIDYVTTSGTLGDPVTFALTDADLDRLALNEFLSFTTAGCTSQDVIQLMTTIDRRFMAGLAYFLGARKLGAGIVRVGNGIAELQWDTIRRIDPTVCIVVPSFLLKLIEFARANNIDHNSCSLRHAICIGEPIRHNSFGFNTLGAKINREWPNLTLHSTYASTEMQSSFTECSQCRGGHHQPELIIVEFLDEDDNPVAENEAGEVTVTTLGVEGMPLLRFKTGDICYRTQEKCGCGRQTMRLSPVVGRKGQMIKYKGTTLYPDALYDVLDNIAEIENYIIEVYTNSMETDEILLKIGSRVQSEQFVKQIKDLFRAKIRVAPDVRFEPVEYIEKLQHPDSCRKRIKFIDLRNDSLKNG